MLLFVQFLPLHTVHATENNNIIEIHPEDYEINTLNITDEDYDANSVVLMQTLTQTNGGYKIFIERGDNLYYSTYLNFTSRKTLNNGLTDSLPFMEHFVFDKVDKSKIFSKNSSFSLDITNIINNVEFTDNDGISYKFYFQPTAVKKIRFEFVDISNRNYYANADSFSVKKNKNDSNLIDISVTCNNVPCDVYRLYVILEYTYQDAYGYGGLPFSNSLIRNSGYINGRIAFNESLDNGNKGLLNSIIALINNIKDGITNLPSKIASSIKSFFDNVVNAVTNVMNAVTNIGDLIKNAIVNLGTFLIDGIKGLFVPSEEDITEMQERWTSLLSDRFGALYQTVELIDNYANAFTSQEKNTITMPSVTIPLADSEFVFGGWEVQVVPDGFGVVFDTLKLIISIVCTIWFVNGLKNRFERLVGGANNI